MQEDISLSDYSDIPECIFTSSVWEVREDRVPYFPGKDLYENGILRTYKGNHMPHWSSDGIVYEVCFRLADSVPEKLQQEWLSKRRELQEITTREQRELTEQEKKQFQYLYSQKVEAFLDSGHGSCLLKEPGVSEIVRLALEYNDHQKYLLHAWCIMPNHVHMLFQILGGTPQGEILQGWKSYTAHAVNRFLKRKGPLWQTDCYNHIIRTEAEYYQRIRYIWNNPEKAGFQAWKYRWKCLKE